MVAGEASGDLLAGLLLDGLRKRWPQLQAAGHRRAADGRAAASRPGGPTRSWRCSGYVEVLRHYRELVGIRNQLRERLLAGPPAGVHRRGRPRFQPRPRSRAAAPGHQDRAFRLPVDLGLARRAGRQDPAQLPTMCCASSRSSRSCSPAHGIAADLRGPSAGQCHPDGARPGRRTARAWDCGKRARCWPSCRAAGRRKCASSGARASSRAAALVRKARPGIQLRGAGGSRAAGGASKRPRVPAGLGADLEIVDGQSHAVLAACDLALVASGTATLEAALFKRPMVISYAVNWLTYRLMKPRQLQPWVGLPNILCGDFVVPELMQDDAKPEALAAALLEWLESPARMAAVQEKFKRAARTRCSAIPPHWPPMRSKKSSNPEPQARPGPSSRVRSGAAVIQAHLPWDPVGLMAGVDEAGRGPLAGPVVAAAVILDDTKRIRGLADSKVLTPLQRDRLYDQILRQGAVLLRGAGERGGNRHAQHPAGHHARHEARGGRPAAEAGEGAGRWQPPARAGRARRSRDRRRCHRQGDIRRFHPGQGAPRPAAARPCTRNSPSTALPRTRATARRSTWRRCACTARAGTTASSSARSPRRSRSRRRGGDASPSRDLTARNSSAPRATRC